MLFNSLEFVVFFPIVFAVYWFARQNCKLQNAIFVVASGVFYAWVDWRFVFLIGFTAMLTYITGRALLSSRLNREKKGYIIVNIVINLAILGYFKYYNFFIDSFNDAFRSMGVALDMPTLQLILPVGISFYTFKAISYSVDLYKNKIVGGHNLLSVLCYLMFFPQLLAGPIEKARDLYPQFLQPRCFNYSQAIAGSKMIIWGLFKKVVIADTACNIVNSIYGDIGGYNSSALLICAVLYSFQIYGDFSGYSDMAVGIGKLFGIESKKKFNLP